ncbi:hypothetical protein LEP3755_19380 [Leptolyngbya sp. NIES-3755]|nr:hypothetical protein LEP3755_19380 [Leptolyngbya sp. NIES-3755]
MLVATQNTVLLSGEWLEAFWCDECQSTEWYHVRRLEGNHYQISLAPAELWQQAIGVMHPTGNPSVGEFTKQQARMVRYGGVSQFHFVS